LFNCVTRTGRNDGIYNLASVSTFVSIEGIITMVVLWFTPCLIDELEEIFFAGYPLFHEEPKFKPVILHSMVQWALDEIPFLLQNQTFKDSFHFC
jgi:hypothetical protein